MHGALFRKIAYRNTKDLGVTPIREGGNMVKSKLGYKYEPDLDELYSGNPYFKKDIMEQAKSYEGLQRTVPEERQMQNNKDMEPAFFNDAGESWAVRKKQTLDDLYADNPYYRPAKA